MDFSRVGRAGCRPASVILRVERLVLFPKCRGSGKTIENDRDYNNPTIIRHHDKRWMLIDPTDFCG